jgi:hypothetical protein
MARQRAVETLAIVGMLGAHPRQLAGVGLGHHRRPSVGRGRGGPPVRALTVFVFVMGVIIIIGFGVVAAVIAGRMARGNAPAAVVAQHSATTTIDIPKGARVEGMTTAPDRLILDLLLPDGGHRLVIVDLSSGARVGTIELQPVP